MSKKHTKKERLDRLERALRNLVSTGQRYMKVIKDGVDTTSPIYEVTAKGTDGVHFKSMNVGGIVMRYVMPWEEFWDTMSIVN